VIADDRAGIDRMPKRCAGDASGSVRSRPPIREAHDLAQFVDGNAAFLVQTGIYGARSGHYAKVLFKETEFVEVVERSRWAARVTLCNIHDELTKRLVAEARADALRARAS
jgi:hypothetical protein